MRKNFCLLLIFFTGSGWSQIQPQSDRIRERINWAIRTYQDGEYERVILELKRLIPEAQKQNQARNLMDVYKYLAFSYVMQDIITKGQDTFREALNLFPSMELDTLSVPPNIMVVFKNIKLEKALERAKQEQAASRPVQPVKKSHTGRWVTTGVVATAAAGGTVYLLMKDNDQDPPASQNFPSPPAEPGN